MEVQINNLTTDYTSENPITTFKVTFKTWFKQYHFDVKVNWHNNPEDYAFSDEDVCQHVVDSLSTNKSYKKINSGMSGSIDYTAYYSTLRN